MGSKGIIPISVLLISGVAFLYLGERRRAADLQAELDSLRRMTNGLGARIAELEGSRLDITELERLRAEQREAIRLRGELQNLKLQVSSANQSAAKATAEAGKARAKAKAAEEGSVKYVVPKVFSNQTQASLPSGQSLMVGGWETAPGKRTYAFMSPTTNANSPNQVLVTGRLVEMDLAVANQFASMATDANGNVTFNAEDSQALFDGFKDMQGVKVLAAPRIQTISGRAGNVAVTRQMPTADGYVNFGPEIGVTPTIGPDGKIHIVIDAKITVEDNGS